MRVTRDALARYKAGNASALEDIAAAGPGGGEELTAQQSLAAVTIYIYTSNRGRWRCAHASAMPPAPNASCHDEERRPSHARRGRMCPVRHDTPCHGDAAARARAHARRDATARRGEMPPNPSDVPSSFLTCRPIPLTRRPNPLTRRPSLQVRSCSRGRGRAPPPTRRSVDRLPPAKVAARAAVTRDRGAVACRAVTPPTRDPTRHRHASATVARDGVV